MAKDHGPGIKDDALYEALRKQGESKEKAARIANAKAAGTLDHKGTTLEDRSRAELYGEAKKIGIEGRSKMSKSRAGEGDSRALTFLFLPVPGRNLIDPPLAPSAAGWIRIARTAPPSTRNMMRTASSPASSAMRRPASC